MKKLTLTLMMALVLILAACGGGSDEKANEGDEATIDYPEKSIQIINPFPAGGLTDAVSRAIAKALPKYLPNDDQQIIVENSPLGGVGSIGATKVINSEPDGYTIGLVPASTIVVQPHFGEVEYTYEDLKPLIETSSSEGMLVVPADAPYDTFDEWLEYVEANPGKFKYSTAGAGSLQHIQSEALIDKIDIDIKHVPYDGTAESTAALLGNHVDGAILQPNQATEHIEAGSFKALVAMGSSKADGLEDVPLLTEVGVDLAVDNFTLMFAQKDLPDEVFEVLQEALVGAMSDEEVIKVIENAGETPQETIGEDLDEKIKDTYISSGEAIEASGLNK